jgi:hypothetical protein
MKLYTKYVTTMHTGVDFVDSRRDLFVLLHCNLVPPEPFHCKFWYIIEDLGLVSGNQKGSYSSTVVVLDLTNYRTK